jgi:heme oxygenase (biliverdin-IX-beta and delta-forming)
VNAAHRALREGTRAEHETLDALFGGFDLADRASYGAFLSAHAAALLPVEAALDAAGAAELVPDWPQRKRGARLAADLEALGLPVPEGAPYAIASGDAAAIVGAMYVIEGSRLGGRLLARQVAPELPSSYLDSDQAQGAWRALLEKFDAILHDAMPIESAIEEARAIFARFGAAGERWLEGE